MTRWWGVAGAAAAVALVAVPGPASAAPVDESGYWWRYQPAAGSPLAPPGVADGQLLVEADAAGPSAVAAIRVEVGDRGVDSLVLVEAASSGSPDLAACPTSGWTAPDGAGAFAERPSEDRCADQRVFGERSAGGTWVFEVGGLVEGGVLDVVVVPSAEPQSVTFEAPSDDTVVLTPPRRPAPAAAAPPAPPARPAPSTAAAAPFTPPAADVAIEPTGTPAAALQRDVDPFPAPASPSTPAPVGDDGGGRAPLALLAVAIPIAAWTYRTRAALRAAGDHVLAAPLRVRHDALTTAGAAVIHEPGTEPGGTA